MTDAITYTATTKKGAGVTAAGKIMEGLYGIVVRSDGVEVWASRKLYGGKRGASAAQLQANRAVGAFRLHYAREGVCWHAQRQAKRLAHREWAKQRLALVVALEAAVRLGVDDAIARAAGQDVATPRLATEAERAAFAIGREAAKSLPPEPEKA